jgi:hypothetical protein
MKFSKIFCYFLGLKISEEFPIEQNNKRFIGLNPVQDLWAALMDVLS